ncbi:MAG TPA: hypothetical protein PLP31_03465 [Thermoanaerobaculaceae bacterium]|nr:hypothetical protein [Thermoanaerobaculaceae bacterium]
MRAHPVRELRLVTARALGLRRRLEVVMGAAAVAPGLGVAVFRIRHHIPPDGSLVVAPL